MTFLISKCALVNKNRFEIVDPKKVELQIRVSDFDEIENG